MLLVRDADLYIMARVRANRVVQSSGRRNCRSVEIRYREVVGIFVGREGYRCNIRVKIFGPPVGLPRLYVLSGIHIFN